MAISYPEGLIEKMRSKNVVFAGEGDSLNISVANRNSGEKVRSRKRAERQDRKTRQQEANDQSAPSTRSNEENKE